MEVLAFGSERFMPSDLDVVDPMPLRRYARYSGVKLDTARPDELKSPVMVAWMLLPFLREGVLIQCKSSTVNEAELGWEAVKDVVAGAAAYSARHPEVTFSLIAATNKRFNGTARLQAAFNNVALYEGDELASMLSQTPVTRNELSQYLFEGGGINNSNR
jgi:hypothetical protein